MFKLHLTKKKIVTVCGVLVLGSATFLGLVYTAALSAGQIFNKLMAKQTFFNGTITCEALVPDLLGNVYFRNLLLFHKGENVLLVPKGRIKLNLWDIARRHITANSVQELELADIDLCLRFNKDMELDLLPHVKQLSSQHSHRQQKLNERLLNLEGDLPNFKFVLNNANIAAYYRNREFVLHNSHCQIEVQQHHILHLAFTSHNFGGTMVGQGCDINGTINISDKEPDIGTLNLGLYNVVPKSLGLGNLENPLTITGTVHGDMANPEIDGAINMHKLQFPNLLFYDLAGNYHYQNGVATFKDVTAEFNEGRVHAYGIYNFDKRTYHIHALGEDINLASAIKHSNLHGKVNLEMDFYAVPNTKNALIIGNFASSKGSYLIFPYKTLSGNVTNQNGHLAIRDIILDTEIGTVTTDYMIIKDKQLHYSPLYFESPEHDKQLMLKGK